MIRILSCDMPSGACKARHNTLSIIRFVVLDRSQMITWVLSKLVVGFATIPPGIDKHLVGPLHNMSAPEDLA